MKILVLLILSLLHLAGFAQQEKSDTLLKAAITTVGKPDGAQTEMKIGIDGGSLVSSDGKAELIIPEGSVTKKTSFSIQPVTNTVPNGNGKAYRLEPSGIQFKKPVQLVFHYDEEESKDSMQLLMGIAMQDDKGQWYGLKNFALDTVAKTITGNISHFSDWSNFNKIKLYPSYRRLKVKKSFDMEIDVVSSEDEDLSPLSSSGDERAPLKKRKIPWTAIWNKTAGTLKVQSKTTATFTAPATIPNQNPVAVTVNLNGLTYKYKGTLFSTLKLVSNILIYDNAYEVKMISSIDGTAGSQLGKVTYTDSGSFVISVNGKESKIIEKLNKNTPDKFDYHGKCIVTQLKPGSGNIHIIGAKSIKVIPAATTDGNPWVEIEFIRVPSIFPLLQFKCPPVGKGDWTTTTNATGNAMMAGMLPAFPQRIKFELKEGEQTQIIGDEGSAIFLKYTIKQLKEE